MNHKHLLRFIKKKMKNEQRMEVATDKKTGRKMTLGEVRSALLIPDPRLTPVALAE